MALTFPGSPTTGQVFVNGNDSWKWDGSVWLRNPKYIANTKLSTNAVILTADATTAHTLGVWTEVNSSIPANVGRISAYISSSTFVNGVSTAMIVDFGYGPDSSTVTTVIEGVMTGYRNASVSAGTPGSPPALVNLPLALPSGQKLYARTQSSVLSKTVSMIVEMWTGASVQSVDTYGLTRAASRGTTITSPVAPGAMGAWTLIGTATRDYQALMVSLGGVVSTTMAANNIILSIGAGSGPTELFQMYWATGTSEILTPYGYLLNGATVASGEGIYARYQRDGTAVTLDVIIHAVPLS